MQGIVKAIKNIRYQLPTKKFLVKIITLLPGFILMRLNQLVKILPQNTKKILFVLDDQKFYSMGDGNSRYLYMLLQRFSQAGYNVYFYKRVTFKIYYHLETLGKLIFNLKNLKVLTRLPKDTSDMIFAFDRVDCDMLQRHWKKLAYINIFKPTFCQVGGRVWIPYAMFPVIYDIGEHKMLDAYRVNSRKLRILFAGNASPIYYNNRKISNFYGQLTRIEAVNVLRESGGKVKCAEGKEGFTNLMSTADYTNECRLLLTDASFPIKPADWLGLVSKSDFFICLAGTDYPMCHNAIEAMAVGTIPIISYHDWFFPPLEHGKNAIVYSGKDDLIKKINEVFSIPADAINKMRGNVIEYYEKHLSNESFIKVFESRPEKVLTVMLHPKLVCSDAENAQGKEFFNNLQSVLGLNQLQSHSTQKAGV